MRRKPLTLLPALSALLLLAAMPHCTPGPDKERRTQAANSYTEQLRPIRDTIQSLVRRSEIPSMAVAVALDGHVIWEEAFGWADIERQIPATPETIYGLGSMAKSICATGVMTLVEQGRISLDDRVNDLIAPARLTGYAGSGDDVSIWHLLNMCAGIPHGWTSFADPDNVPATATGKDSLLQRYGLVTFPPGRVYHYANYSMGVADLVMERASGMPLDEFLPAALFRPLGMTNALVRFDRATAGQQLATPYSAELEPLPHTHFLPFGGGGYLASVRDLLRYARFHLHESLPGSEAVLSPEAIDLMHRFDRGPVDLFHLGWFGDGVKLISNGNITGFNSCLVLVPGRRLAVVTLTNLSSQESIADQITFRIVDSLAKSLPEGITREKYEALYETPYSPTPELRGRWTGTVKTQGRSIPVRIEFQDSISIRIGDQPRQKLEGATFNSLRMLHGSCQSALPVPEFTGAEPVYTWLNLYLDGRRLTGHIAPIFSNERGSFCYGAYVELGKER